MSTGLRLPLLVAFAAFAVGCGAERQLARPADYAFDPLYGTYGAPPQKPYPSLGNAPYPGSTAPAQGSVAARFAEARLNTPYCWGGTGPGCYDCSGLTYASWRAAGRLIPRTSAAQLASLPPVPMTQLQPGDIVWRPGHVGLYVGQGWVVHAPHTNGVVEYQSMTRFQRAVRP